MSLKGIFILPNECLACESVFISSIAKERCCWICLPALVGVFLYSQPPRDLIFKA